MPEDTPDITGADSGDHEAIGGYGYVTARCFASGCEANRLVPCTPWGAPTAPQGGWGMSGARGAEWFACPEHLPNMRRLLGLSDSVATDA